jgi:cytochrome c-type biogenesis protein CcmH
MIAFWSISALLVAGALLFLLPPLLRRPDTSAPQAASRHPRSGHARRRDARGQRAALQLASEHARSGRIAAIAVGLGIPLVSVLLYFQLGNPQGLTARKAEPTQTARQTAAALMETRVASLVAYLEQNPKDLKAWAMLARSFGAMGRYTDAGSVYAELVTLIPDSAQLWAEYAQALAWANGKKLQGKPLELVNKALQLDPNNRQALALAARAELDSGHHAGAIAYWEHLLRLLPADSEGARSVTANLARARKLAGTGTSTASIATSSGAPEKPQIVLGKSISGVVSLKKNLASGVSPGDAVFLYAHAPDARGMPLAVVRFHVKDLPAAFSLDDSKAMTSASKLSDFPEVSVVARISKTGNALPRSGDLQGAIPLVTVGTGSVTIDIDTVLP